MNKNDQFALAKRPFGAVEKNSPGAKRILSSMVADALIVAKRGQTALAGARFRIGDSEWREPDYRQILLWAKALVLEPVEVIQELLTINERWRNEAEAEGEIAEEAPIFEDGAIVKVY